jgi:hypothetical protein
MRNETKLAITLWILLIIITGFQVHNILEQRAYSEASRICIDKGYSIALPTSSGYMCIKLESWISVEELIARESGKEKSTSGGTK